MSGRTKRPLLCQDGQVTVFDYDPDTYVVTTEMREVFDWDGCFIIRGILSAEEVARIEECLHAGPEFMSHAYELADGQGRKMRMVLWKHPGDDVTGMLARSEKVVNTCEALLGDEEVYHYGTKVMMKEARTGGAHLWHQDYGYWYQNGFLRPDLLTVYMPLDKCMKANGCLQVVKGTHRCGRIDHCPQAGQTAADQKRVDELLKHFDHVYAEMIPGDALFFHSNLLHRAGKNDSDMRRWSLLSSYSRADNDPVYKHHSPNYTKLNKVPNSAILECTNMTDLSGKDFLDPVDDKTVDINSKASG